MWYLPLRNAQDGADGGYSRLISIGGVLETRDDRQGEKSVSRVHRYDMSTKTRPAVGPFLFAACAAVGIIVWEIDGAIHECEILSYSAIM